MHDRRNKRNGTKREKEHKSDEWQDRKPNPPSSCLLGLPTNSTPTPTSLRLRVLLHPKSTPDELGREVYRGAFQHLHRWRVDEDWKRTRRRWKVRRRKDRAARDHTKPSRTCQCHSMRWRGQERDGGGLTSRRRWVRKRDPSCTGIHDIHHYRQRL